MISVGSEKAKQDRLLRKSSWNWNPRRMSVAVPYKGTRVSQSQEYQETRGMDGRSRPILAGARFSFFVQKSKQQFHFLIPGGNEKRLKMSWNVNCMQYWSINTTIYVWIITLTNRYHRRYYRSCGITDKCWFCFCCSSKLLHKLRSTRVAFVDPWPLIC